MAAPSPSRSTPTPSRRGDGRGLGYPTDGEWEFETASAGESSSEEDIRRNSELIRLKFHEDQEGRHQREQAVRQLPPVAEEDVGQVDLGATAAPEVVET